MFVANLTVLLAMAPAQQGPNQQPGWVHLIPLLVMIFVFYFILIRPQAKQAKQQEKMRGTLQKGDKVVTNGGVVGVVLAVKERTISLRSDDTKLEVLKSAVTSVTDKVGEKSDAKA
jgi:preprotein translocase subunit YajC